MMIAAPSQVRSKGSLRRQPHTRGRSPDHTSSHSLRASKGRWVGRKGMGTAVIAGPITLDMDAREERHVQRRGHTTFRQALAGLSRSTLLQQTLSESCYNHHPEQAQCATNKLGRHRTEHADPHSVETLGFVVDGQSRALCGASPRSHIEMMSPSHEDGDVILVCSLLSGIHINIT